MFGLTKMEITRNIEDYLEAIFNINQTQGFAQTKEIADCLHVTPSSVSGMLKKLKQKGLIKYQKYSPVKLTPKGNRLQKKFRRTIILLKVCWNFYLFQKKLQTRMLALWNITFMKQQLFI